MDITQLLNGVVQNLIAGFPELVVVLTTVTYGLKTIKAKTAMLPQMLDATKVELKKGYDTTKEKMFEVMNQTLTTVEQEMKNTLVDMAGKLANYEKELTATHQQSNLLAQQNKLFMDVIVDLVQGDPTKVQEGIAIAVNNHIKGFKETLEQNPDLIVKDLGVLVETLGSTLKVIGQEEFDKLIGRFGYERKEI